MKTLQFKLAQLLRWNLISFKLNFQYQYSLYVLLGLLIGIFSSMIMRSHLINDHILNNDQLNTFFLMIITILFLFSMLYSMKLISDIIKLSIQAIQIIPHFRSLIKQNIKDIKSIITVYYIQNSCFILLSTWILYHILMKLNLFIEDNSIYIIIWGILSSFWFFYHYPLGSFNMNAIQENKVYSLWVYVLFILFFLFYLFILPLCIIKFINSHTFVQWKENYLHQCIQHSYSYMDSQGDSPNRKIINNNKANTIDNSIVIVDSEGLELTGNNSNNQYDNSIRIMPIQFTTNIENVNVLNQPGTSASHTLLNQQLLDQQHTQNYHMNIENMNNPNITIQTISKMLHYIAQDFKSELDEDNMIKFSFLYNYIHTQDHFKHLSYNQKGLLYNQFIKLAKFANNPRINGLNTDRLDKIFLYLNQDFIDQHKIISNSYLGNFLRKETWIHVLSFVMSHHNFHSQHSTLIHWSSFKNYLGFYPDWNEIKSEWILHSLKDYFHLENKKSSQIMFKKETLRELIQEWKGDFNKMNISKEDITTQDILNVLHYLETYQIWMSLNEKELYSFIKELHLYSKDQIESIIQWFMKWSKLLGNTKTLYFKKEDRLAWIPLLNSSLVNKEGILKDLTLISLINKDSFLSIFNYIIKEYFIYNERKSSINISILKQLLNQYNKDWTPLEIKLILEIMKENCYSKSSKGFSRDKIDDMILYLSIKTEDINLSKTGLIECLERFIQHLENEYSTKRVGLKKFHYFAQLYFKHLDLNQLEQIKDFFSQLFSGISWTSSNHMITSSLLKESIQLLKSSFIDFKFNSEDLPIIKKESLYQIIKELMNDPNNANGINKKDLSHILTQYTLLEKRFIMNYLTDYLFINYQIDNPSYLNNKDLNLILVEMDQALQKEDRIPEIVEMNPIQEHITPSVQNKLFKIDFLLEENQSEEITFEDLSFINTNEHNYIDYITDSSENESMSIDSS